MDYNGFLPMPGDTKMNVDAYEIERGIVLALAKELAPAAIALLPLIPDGLYLSANDATATGLAAAHANATVRQSRWCTSQYHADHADQIYYCDLDTGQHGWMCSACKGIMQVS